MIKGIAHVHFREGERGPEEATLDFDQGIALLEEHSVQEVAVTFHLRHPRDLRLATPALLLERIAQYSGPVKLTLMPEANLVVSRGSGGDRSVSHDIGTWDGLDIAHDRLSTLLGGWIVSAHYTKALGWTNQTDDETAPEQTYTDAARSYETIMRQDWQGWIGHPFRWCSGLDPQEPLKQVLTTAIETGHVIEIPVESFDRANPPSTPMLQPAIIAGFGGKPLIAISTDAHHLDQLKQRLDGTYALTEWLLSEGVRPEQLWNL
jgi:hypothetical protein